MMQYSLFFRLFKRLGQIVKESRIYELISKMFYFSKFSFIFLLIGKEPKNNAYYNSVFKKSIESILNWKVEILHKPIKRFKSASKNSLILRLIYFNREIIRKNFVSIILFYSFVFFAGYCIAMTIKNQFTIKKVALLFIPGMLNLLNINWNMQRYLENSFFVNVFKKITKLINI